MERRRRRYVERHGRGVAGRRDALCVGGRRDGRVLRQRAGGRERRDQGGRHHVHHHRHRACGRRAHPPQRRGGCGGGHLQLHLHAPLRRSGDVQDRRRHGGARLHARRVRDRRGYGLRRRFQHAQHVSHRGPGGHPQAGERRRQGVDAPHERLVRDPFLLRLQVRQQLDHTHRMDARQRQLRRPHEQRRPEEPLGKYAGYRPGRHHDPRHPDERRNLPDRHRARGRILRPLFLHVPACKLQLAPAIPVHGRTLLATVLRLAPFQPDDEQRSGHRRNLAVGRPAYDHNRRRRFLGRYELVHRRPRVRRADARGRGLDPVLRRRGGGRGERRADVYGHLFPDDRRPRLPPIREDRRGQGRVHAGPRHRRHDHLRCRRRS